MHISTLLVWPFSNDAFLSHGTKVFAFYAQIYNSRRLGSDFIFQQKFRDILAYIISYRTANSFSRTHAHFVRLIRFLRRSREGKLGYMYFVLLERV